MTDPITAIASLASVGKAADPMNSEVAKGGVALWMKFLGPPAEAVGAHFKSRIELWSEDALARRVLEKAARKADTSKPGTVSPRVASDIFDKAQWADDEFVAEYLSGVLASSRTPDGVDDSGVSWTALVGRLSSAQLRLHFILYSTARHHLTGRQIEAVNDLENLPIFVPLFPVLQLLGGEADTFNEAIMNLIREGLLSDRYAIDTAGAGTAPGKAIPEGPAMVYRLSNAGVMLYMRGGGSRDTMVRAIADEAATTTFDAVDGIPIPIPGSSLRDELPDASPPEEGETPASGVPTEG
ncbi:hypothetical protein [Microbacterium oxydans]|uniref:hypothetical protein n=1 Tax=Microbacterium oxydans TaxID=82380 RepID=UPI0037CB11B0